MLTAFGLGNGVDEGWVLLEQRREVGFGYCVWRGYCGWRHCCLG